MWIDYGGSVAESIEELAEIGRRLRGRAEADRVKLLLALRSGRERSLRRAAAVLGYSERQAQRWWRAYRSGGLAALLERRPREGRRERVGPAAWAALEAEMRAGRVARLREAQAFLRDRHGIAYSLNGVSLLFKRHRVKLKTGRRRHRKADAAAQAAFKKGVRGRTGAARGRAGLRHG
ncbi:MAG: winged helix-turn-helix domain-containing protein [Acetobacteraceae bacterium]|nr:winged helix-turn-helix domain-containing protein [Acetobacteraceae bacterium]